MAAYRLEHRARVTLFLSTFFILSPSFASQIPTQDLLAPHTIAPPTTEVSKHYQALSGTIEKDIAQVKGNLEALLKKALRTELAPTGGPDMIIKLDNPNVRARLKNLLNASIKMKFQQLEHLEKQQNYLSGEMKIGSALAGQESAPLALAMPYSCNNFPLVSEQATTTTFQKNYSFGELLNPSLGKSSAKSQGIWWNNTYGAFVQVCNAGEVILSEFVEGRGYVVGVKHNQQLITLYGNLDPVSLKGVRVGMKIPRGMLLGVALDRFYFEARRGGEAIDPDQLFAPKQADVSVLSPKL